MIPRFAGLLAVVALAAGCEKKADPVTGAASAAPVDAAPSSSAVAAGAPPDREAVKTACEERTRVHRTAEDRWSPSSSPRDDVAREALMCTAQAALPGSGLTPDAIRECARAEDELATRSILLWGDTSEYCTVRGHLEQGTRCTVDSQCASGHCLVARGAECGTCGAPLPSTPGDACSVDRCAVGLKCNGDTCVLPRAVGAACDGKSACSAEGTCLHGKCAPLAKKGEVCDPDASIAVAPRAPDCGRGLECSPRHVCVELARPRQERRRKLGESCEKADCENGYCTRRGNETGAWTCVAYDADDAPCDPDAHSCRPPALCSRASRHCEIRGSHACN